MMMNNDKANNLLKEWQNKCVEQLKKHNVEGALNTHTKIYNFVMEQWSVPLKENEE
jgi:hypothetical protein